MVSIFKKDVAMLSQHRQHILLKIHQYRVQIIYKPGSEIFIAHWLSRHNHMEGKDKPIKDMDIRIDAIQSVTDIPEWVSISQIQQTSTQDDHLQCLKGFIIAGWPSTKEELHTAWKLYWSYRDELVVIDTVMLKGRHIIIPTSLKQQVLDQHHTNHMGIEKTKLLTHESVYWSDVNVDIEKYITSCASCLEFQQTQPKEKIIHNDIPLRPWEVFGADVFHFSNKNYLCIVDYHSKFPMDRRVEGLSAEGLIAKTKIIFAKYGIPHKLISDAGTNFVSDMFQKFCNSIRVEQVVSSMYHHQSNGQVKACIKFIKRTFKNALTAVGRSTWPYYKFIQLHWAKAYWAQQH